MKKLYRSTMFKAPPNLLTLLIVSAILLLAPCSATYSSDGIPLQISAQGAIRGEVVSSWSFGLEAPPYVHQFSLNGQPVWARVYTGVWGGTEQYRGWVQVDINGRNQEKTTLYGKDDMNTQVSGSGNGVYWITTDATEFLNSGENTITVTTSRGEPDNKLDGRVYGIYVVALVQTRAGPVIQYWIADGNENLHGEGWAGTSSTRHDQCSLIFPGITPGDLVSANLTTVLITSTRGQPDYITFNGKDLGLPASPTADYLSGAYDIGNERSLDATGGSGVDTRYGDVEVFDVTPSLERNQNEVVFERGRDLNGDGSIQTTGVLSEGEDYIHPVLAMLVVQRDKDSIPTDLSVDALEIRNAYDGDQATISATIRNTGLVPSGPAEVAFSVDGNTIDWKPVSIGYEGIESVQGTWKASPGDHTISVSVTSADDPDLTNNAASRSIRVGSLPDLSISLGDPVRAPGTNSDVHGSPFPVVGSFLGGLAILWWLRRRGPSSVAVPAIFLISGILALSLVPVVSGAVGDISEYSIPVKIKNKGGSDAPGFLLTVYLDGEKVTEFEVSDGVPAGGVLQVSIPLFSTPGRHTLRVVADERETIPEEDRADNMAERAYELS